MTIDEAVKRLAAFAEGDDRLGMPREAARLVLADRERLKEELDSHEIMLDEEEVEHTDTLRLWQLVKAQRDELLAMCKASPQAAIAKATKGA